LSITQGFGAVEAVFEYKSRDAECVEPVGNLMAFFVGGE
jgi:hypothetical protein